MEVCPSCSECRDGRLRDEPWFPATRYQRREGDYWKSYGHHPAHADRLVLFQSRPLDAA